MLWCSVFIPLMQLCFFSTLHVGLECLGTYHWLYTAFLRGVVGYIDFSMNLKSTTKCRTYYWVSHEGYQSEPARFYNRFLIFKTTNVLRLILPVWGFLLWFHSYSQYLFTSCLLTIYWSPVNNLKCRSFNPSLFWSQTQLLTVSLHISFFLFCIAQWDLQRFNMTHKTAFNHEFRLTLRCWEEHHNRQAEEKNPAADREGRPHLHADRVPAVNSFLFFLLLCAEFAKVWG